MRQSRTRTDRDHFRCAAKMVVRIVPSNPAKTPVMTTGWRLALPQLPLRDGQFQPHLIQLLDQGTVGLPQTVDLAPCTGEGSQQETEHQGTFSAGKGTTERARGVRRLRGGRATSGSHITIGGPR